MLLCTQNILILLQVVLGGGWRGAEMGMKDALHISAYSGKSAQTDPKTYSFYSKVIFQMVISYVAGTSAGATVVLQSTQPYPRVTLGCWREGTQMTGS